MMGGRAVSWPDAVEALADRRPDFPSFRSFSRYDKPDPGSPTFPYSPCRPNVTLAPRTPAETLAPRLPRFRRTPGKILTVLRKRKAIDSNRSSYLLRILSLIWDSLGGGATHLVAGSRQLKTR